MKLSNTNVMDIERWIKIQEPDPEGAYRFVEAEDYLDIMQLYFEDNKPRRAFMIMAFADIIYYETNPDETMLFSILLVNESEDHALEAWLPGFSAMLVRKGEPYFNLILKGGLFNEVQPTLPRLANDEVFSVTRNEGQTGYENIHVKKIKDYYAKQVERFNNRRSERVREGETSSQYKFETGDLIGQPPLTKRIYRGYERDKVLPDNFFDCTNLRVLGIWSCYLESDDLLKINTFSNLSILSLNKNSLSQLPDALCDLPYLVELDVSDNHFIDVLPKDFGRLTTLKRLNLSGNKFSRFPDAIELLSNLEELVLANNTCAVLPEGMKALHKLYKVDVSGNPLKKIPEVLLNLLNCEYLNLSGCELTSLPRELLSLDKLKILNLQNNPLQEIPDWIVSFENLESLDISHCSLTTLPDNIGKLSGIKKFNVKGNKFISLPATMKKIRKRAVQLEPKYKALYDEKTRGKLEKNKNKALKTVFKDFNFKLMVIQKLIYEMEILIPKFNVYDFAKNYKTRSINIDEEGYEIIPEGNSFLKT